MSREALAGMPGPGGFVWILLYVGSFFALVAHFFDFFTHLKSSCIFVWIFSDVPSIFRSLGKVLGGILKGFFNDFL